MPPPGTGAFCCGYNDPSVRQHMAQLQCKRPYSGTEHVDGPENFNQPEPQIVSMSIDSPLSILPLLPVPFIDLPPSSFPSVVTSPFLRRRPDRRPRGDEQQRGVGLHGAAEMMSGHWVAASSTRGSLPRSCRPHSFCSSSGAMLY